jgi:hypothetical protein
MTPSPTPSSKPSPTSGEAEEPAIRTDGWSSRWGDTDDAEPTPSQRRGPRVTHLVLVDGLPADHWVEDGSDGRWESRLRRRVGPALSTGHDDRERELRWLDCLVGGREALVALDDRPLVARPLDLGDLAPDVQVRARAISEDSERHAVEVFGLDELGAAVGHLLGAALAVDPAMLHRSARDDTAMGALVWAAGQANGLIGPEGQLLARELWPRLGVPPSAAGRGAALVERLAPGTAQLVAPPGAPRLRPTGLPGALLGSTRALLMNRRDEVLGPGLR